MPIRVRYKNLTGQECTVRPTPLVAISSELNKTAAGDILGVTYSITLTGTLLPDVGTPYALSNITQALYEFHDPAVLAKLSLTGPYETFDNNMSHFGNHRPDRQKVGEQSSAQSIFMKQRSLRELFANHGQRMEITDVEFDTSSIICYPRVESISFTEGTYITKCDYTITLSADTLYTTANQNKVDADGHRDQSKVNPKDGSIDEDEDPTGSDGGRISPFQGNTVPLEDEQKFIDAYGNAFISDFQESWAVEVDESQAETISLNDESIDRTYRITHNISAVGKDHYRPLLGDPASVEVERLLPWVQAKKFVQSRLSYGPHEEANRESYPNQTGVANFLTDPNGTPLPNFLGKIGAGTLDLVDDYGGYNHVRTENVDEGAGSYSVTESWLLARGSAYETYNLNISSSTGGPFTKISINGNIKGLSPLKANATEYGGKNDEGRSGSGPYLATAYESALTHYNKLSNNQEFGIGSLIYKRANNQTQVALNSEPLSITLGSNRRQGELTYALEFDNRPTNIISNVVSETINVNDTYPGDAFAAIQVIGRATGPVLQYIGGRSEYKRDISINLIMDYTKIPYSSTRRSLLLLKPSVNEPTATEIATLLGILSPAGEPGVRKYFIGPPSESWEPKTGSYSLNLSFTYELNR